MSRIEDFYKTYYKNVSPSTFNVTTSGNKIIIEGIDKKYPKNFKPKDVKQYPVNQEKFNNGGLIAPNGRKSNLTAKQYKLVRTKQFKNWFGDWELNPNAASKVVDENGEPLVCYHSTDKKFTSFDSNYSFDGFWFTESKTKLLNQEAGAGGQGIIYDVFLNIRNIGDWDDYDKGLDIVKREGYNGVKLDDDFLVFEPTQIKFANGSNTRFDPHNSDIRFNNGGKVKVAKAEIGNVYDGAHEGYFVVELIGDYGEVGKMDVQYTKPSKKIYYSNADKYDESFDKYFEYARIGHSEISESYRGSGNYVKMIKKAVEKAVELGFKGIVSLYDGEYEDERSTAANISWLTMSDPVYARNNGLKITSSDKWENQYADYYVELAPNNPDIRYKKGGKASKVDAKELKMSKGGAIELVHVYDKDGSMYGTGEIVKKEKGKTYVRFDAETVKSFDSQQVKPIEISFLKELLEDAKEEGNIVVEEELKSRIEFLEELQDDVIPYQKGGGVNKFTKIIVKFNTQYSPIILVFYGLHKNKPADYLGEAVSELYLPSSNLLNLSKFKLEAQYNTPEIREKIINIIKNNNMEQTGKSLLMINNEIQK